MPPSCKAARENISLHKCLSRNRAAREENAPLYTASLSAPKARSDLGACVDRGDSIDREHCRRGQTQALGMDRRASTGAGTLLPLRGLCALPRRSSSVRPEHLVLPLRGRPLVPAPNFGTAPNKPATRPANQIGWSTSTVFLAGLSSLPLNRVGIRCPGQCQQTVGSGGHTATGTNGLAGV